jgi:hypothetical protein
MNAEIARLKAERPDLVAEYNVDLLESEALRKILRQGVYQRTGSGDTDLYQAFAWRFWQLVRNDGAVGVVLPRSALSGSGLSEWRETILAEGDFSDVTMLLNRAGWAFDDAEPRYTIGLVSIRKGASHAGHVSMSGPYRSLDSYRSRRGSADISTDEFLSWSDNASFPLLPSPEAAGVFRRMHSQPRLDVADGFKVRAVREFDATNDKHYLDLNATDTVGLWPVYKGASFNLWEPDTSEYYGWADPETVLPVLQDKRERSSNHARSAFSEFPKGWAQNELSLPCRSPRIAFRDVARATDSRTVIAAFVPPDIVLVHTAPYLVFPNGDERDVAYLLGILSSIPLDWVARRAVETHVTFQVLATFPIPRPDRDDPLRLRIETIAGTLAAVDDRYADWADAVGVPVGGIPASERDHYLAELDAAVALLYNLSPDDVTVLFQSFHEGWDYGPRLDAVLDHYAQIEGS